MQSKTIFNIFYHISRILSDIFENKQNVLETLNLLYQQNVVGGG